LIQLAGTDTGLQKILKIEDYSRSRPISKDLFENLNFVEKRGLLCYGRLKAKTFMDQKIVHSIRLKNFEEIISKCEILFYEQEEGGYKVKLVYRDRIKGLCGHRLQSDESVLLEFDIKAKAILNIRRTTSSKQKTNKVIFDKFHYVEFNKYYFCKYLNKLERTKASYLQNTEDTVKKNQVGNKTANKYIASDEP